MFAEGSSLSRRLTPCHALSPPPPARGVRQRVIHLVRTPGHLWRDKWTALSRSLSCSSPSGVVFPVFRTGKRCWQEALSPDVYATRFTKPTFVFRSLRGPKVTSCRGPLTSLVHLSGDATPCKVTPVILHGVASSSRGSRRLASHVAAALVLGLYQRERQNIQEEDGKCVSQKVLTKSFRKSQFPHKSVNVPFIITDINNKLTDLCGN